MYSTKRARPEASAAPSDASGSGTMATTTVSVAAMTATRYPSQRRRANHPTPMTGMKRKSMR